MSEAAPEVKFEGDALEGYVIARTSDLDWVQPENIVIGDDDYIVSKKMAGRILGFVNMNSKSQKALVGHDEEKSNWNKFKKIFTSVCNTLNYDIVLKIENNEIVGVVPADFDRRSNAYVKGNILPRINGKKGLKQVYCDESASDLIVVYANNNLDRIEFAGQKWRAGCVFSYSSIGNYGPSITPALVPEHDSGFMLTLPSTMEEIIYYPKNISELENETDPAQAALSCAASCGAMAERWSKVLGKDLSLYEYESMMTGMLGSRDTSPEFKLLGRFAMAYDAHGLNAEDGRPARDFLKTAWSGTAFGDFLSVAFDISYDVSYHYSPLYAIGTLAESTFNLDLVANNRRPGLDKLTWDSGQG